MSIREVKPTEQTPRILTHDEALDHAKKRIAELGLAQRPQSTLLGHPEVEALKPLLVRDEPEEGPSVTATRYYIVPFARKDRVEGMPAPWVRACVLVSAHTGAFEAVTTFRKPVPYLTKEGAILAVARELHIDSASMTNVEAELMYRSGEITRLRAYPFWRVAWSDNKYYVSQAGKVYDRLERGNPGS